MSAMGVGFTGTRRGLTEPQKRTLSEILARLREAGVKDFHFGDCVGADTEAFEVAFGLNYWTVGHPPTDERERARTFPHTMEEPLPYLARNRAIVEACDVLVACPDQARESLRSGTWATVRYARRLGRHGVLIHPDGSTRPL